MPFVYIAESGRTRIQRTNTNPTAGYSSAFTSMDCISFDVSVFRKLLLKFDLDSGPLDIVPETDVITILFLLISAFTGFGIGS